MRSTMKMLPIALLLSSAPAMAQDAPPRVLFCSGPCFAIDAKGVRTPVQQGTQLSAGQRLETGAGGYAQVKMGRDAAIGVSEQARVRFEGNAVNLDQGRMRMLNGQRPMELRTGDGAFVLRNADVEVKKAGGPRANDPTLMKVNTGTAALRAGQSEVAIPKDAVQGISAGKVTVSTVSVTELAPARPTIAAATKPTVPVMMMPPLSPTVPIPGGREPIVSVSGPKLALPTLPPRLPPDPNKTPIIGGTDPKGVPLAPDRLQPAIGEQKPTIQTINPRLVKQL